MERSKKLISPKSLLVFLFLTLRISSSVYASIGTRKFTCFLSRWSIWKIGDGFSEDRRPGGPAGE